MSLAMKHKKACLEKAAREASRLEGRPAVAPLLAPEKVPDANDIRVALSALDMDLDRLSDLESVEDKIALKRDELLPKYLPILDASLAADQAFHNPMLVRCAIWAFDVEDMETAMRLADACVAQQQLAPEHFKRDLPTFFAETVADWAERQLKEKQSGSPWIDRVCEHLKLGTWPTTNDIVRGKAFKIAGQLAEQNGDLAEALALYERAQEENEKAGCKTRIEKLKSRMDAGA